jgi:hypothetical protein
VHTRDLRQLRVKRRGPLALLSVLAAAGAVHAAPYNLNGTWVEVDYWAGSGSKETILVIDWNQTNGPYTTESHAWGYRWEGTRYLSDAIADVCAAGALDVTTSSGGAFVDDAFYYDPAIDDDHHTSAGYSGWWWAGDTVDGGLTWNGNAGGINTEVLADGTIEGLNMDGENWTSETLTIPVPEPGALALLLLGAAAAPRRRR